ncbi:MAG TPA: glycosyltransferase [Gaiellaceae bacterium]|nr:glycosyltransferase [Gaiellaceae bacterium]
MKSIRPAVFSTYPPRACGIASFAFDLCTALRGTRGIRAVSAVAVVNEPAGPQRSEIVATVEQEARGDYVRAARLLGRLDVDVVLLQHEYGIFGGPDGEYVLSFAQELEQPLVVTLHTVLSRPSRNQLRVLSELCERAAFVIVMTETAARLLEELGVCDAGKVTVVPHGAPALLGRAGRADVRRPLRGPSGGAGRERFLLSTFGLLSPGKGLETAIEALGLVAERHPHVHYVIGGRTHPGVARREGERYRLELERLIADLGLGDHVEFDDRFLSLEELAALLAETRVFLTPYRNREQVASGTLTFAVAAGCAAISTPYWYAEELLGSGAGKLVPFDDPEALARAICEFVEDPAALAAARREARRVGAGHAWPSVAEATSLVLRDAVALTPRRAALPAAALELADVRTDHLLTLVDDVGIVQHAQGVIPNRAHGYCVDDAARLVIVADELARRDGGPAWTSALHRALAFLAAAADPAGGGMHNFMGYDRRWLDRPHVGDHVGRSIWALGEVLATAWAPALVVPVRDLLARLVASLGAEPSLRTGAYAVLGLARLDPDRLEPEAARVLDRLVDRLVESYDRAAAPGWRWFEDALAYDNARLPQALLAGGAATGRDDAVGVGLESLRWYGDQCGLDGPFVRLPGHLGRRRDEPAPGGGDEQPLDAGALVEAEIAAFGLTGDPAHAARARAAFDWFVGRNHLGRPLYDFATGGCADGLGAEAVNVNEGAESTLAFHRARLALDAAGLPAVAPARAGAQQAPARRPEPGQPLTTPIGTRRATRPASPARSTTSTTRSTSL